MVQIDPILSSPFRVKPSEWMNKSISQSMTNHLPPITGLLYIVLSGKTNFNIYEINPTYQFQNPGPRLNIKMVFPRYGDSHVKD